MQNLLLKLNSLWISGYDDDILEAIQITDKSYYILNSQIRLNFK